MSRKIVVDNTILIGEVIRSIKEGKRVTLRVKGNSMRPFISHLDSVDLVPLDSSKIELYDIVLAPAGGNRWVIHRVIEINGSEIVLMGDGNIRGVERCKITEVAARVVSIEHAHSGKVVDLRSHKSIQRAKKWRRLLPLRRYILFALRQIGR